MDLNCSAHMGPRHQQRNPKVTDRIQTGCDDFDGVHLRVSGVWRRETNQKAHGIHRNSKLQAEHGKAGCKLQDHQACPTVSARDVTGDPGTWGGCVSSVTERLQDARGQVHPCGTHRVEGATADLCTRL